MNEWLQSNALRIPTLVGATCRSSRMDRFQHGRSARTVGREDRRINRRIGPVRQAPSGFERRRIQEARQPSTIVEGQARRGREALPRKRCEGAGFARRADGPALARPTLAAQAQPRSPPRCPYLWPRWPAPTRRRSAINFLLPTQETASAGDTMLVFAPRERPELR